MKVIWQVLFVFIAFIFLINLSIKVFNTMEPWIGIGMGLVSVLAFIWALTYFWKKTGTDGKAIEKDDEVKN